MVGTFETITSNLVEQDDYTEDPILTEQISLEIKRVTYKMYSRCHIDSETLQANATFERMEDKVVFRPPQNGSILNSELHNASCQVKIVVVFFPIAASQEIATIVVSKDVVNSSDALITTFYSDSSLFQIAPLPDSNSTIVVDSAVFGFVAARSGSGKYTDLPSPVIITLQSLRAQRNEVCQMAKQWVESHLGMCIRKSYPKARVTLYSTCIPCAS